MPFIEWRPTPDRNVEVLNEEEQEIRFVEDTGADVLPDLGINISGMENE